MPPLKGLSPLRLRLLINLYRVPAKTTREVLVERYSIIRLIASSLLAVRTLLYLLFLYSSSTLALYNTFIIEFNNNNKKFSRIYLSNYGVCYK